MTHGHHKITCKKCLILIGQCRCPGWTGEKIETFETCETCMNIEAKKLEDCTPNPLVKPPDPDFTSEPVESEKESADTGPVNEDQKLLNDLRELKKTIQDMVSRKKWDHTEHHNSLTDLNIMLLDVMVTLSNKVIALEDKLNRENDIYNLQRSQERKT